MSFTRENKDLKSFKKRGMYRKAAENEYAPNAPNWSAYRMSSSLMAALKEMTTHWRITCSFPQYGVDTETDYVRAVFADFDLLKKNKNECKNVSYISVMGQSCSKCTAQWTHTFYKLTPHIAAMQNDSACDIKSDKSGYYYFGAYFTYNPNFRCTESPNSTTNYWFGSYV